MIALKKTSYEARNILLLFLMLLIGLLSTFTWAKKLYIVFFLMGIYAFFNTLKGRMINNKILLGIVLFELLNLASVFSSLLTTSLPINWSWAIQVSLIPFIFLFVYKLFTRYKKEFIKISKFFLFLTISIQLIVIIMAILKYSLFGFLSPTFFFSGEQRMFVHSLKLAFGLDKTLLPLMGISLYLFVTAYERIKFQKTLLFIAILYILTIGSKSVAVGTVLYLLIMYLLKIKNNLLRVTIVTTSILILAILLVSNINLFNEVMILDGRYFMPIFSSDDFWARPFGVGMGNYTLAAYAGLIQVNTHGIFPSVWIHTDMSSPYAMFPIAESDLLLVSVSFGWFTIFLVIVFFAKIFIDYLLNIKIKSKEQVHGFLLFIFLLLSGIFQDFLSLKIVWIFYSIAILMMRQSKKHNVRYK